MSQIQANYSDINYKLISHDVLYLERLQKIHKPQSLIDVFSSYWSIAIGNAPDESVAVSTSHGKKYFKALTIVIVPPFNIVEWNFEKTFQSMWYGFVFKNSYPQHWPKKAFSISTKSNFPSPNDLSSVLSFIDFHFNHKTNCEINYINRDYFTLGTYKKLKDTIDSDLSNPQSISTICNNIGIHPDVASRHFKSTIGITPLKYRNQMRLFHSMWTLLFEGKKISDVALEGGFQSLKNFNEQFLNFTELRPKTLKKISEIMSLDI